MNNSLKIVVGYILIHIAYHRAKHISSKNIPVWTSRLVREQMDHTKRAIWKEYQTINMHPKEESIIRKY